MKIFINEKEQRLRAGWRLLFQFIVMITVLTISTLVLSDLLTAGAMITTALGMFIGVISSVWIAARYVDKRPLADYGINFDKKWAKEFLIGTVVAAAAQLVIFLIEWWAGWLTIAGYGWNFSYESSFWVGIASFFIAMLLVGFHEELFSRGYQILNLTEGLRYPAIGQRAALTIAVILTSSLFGLMHFYNPSASLLSTFNITVAGVVLAIPYILTGSLALSAGLHFSWNFMMAGFFGFPVSGMDIQYSFLQIEQEGSALWTGGAFGPEAGLLGILGMAILAGGSYVYIKMAGYELTTAKILTNEYPLAVKSDEQTP